MSAAAHAAATLGLNENLKRSMQRRLANPADAEDVLQIVAEKLLRTSRHSAGAYLTRTVQNAATDQTRAERTRKDYEAACAEQTLRVDERSPERVVEGIEAIAALQQAVFELKPLCQEIFVRCCVEGQSQPEVADAFGLHLSTVEKRLAKARRHCFDRIRHYLDLT